MDDMVTTEAVLDKLIVDGNQEMLEDAYYMQSKEPPAAKSRSELTDVVVTYTLTYGFRAERRDRSDRPVTEGKIVRGYKKGWPTGRYNWEGLNGESEVVRRENPLLGYNLDVASSIVNRAPVGCGKWTSEAQCQDLKRLRETRAGSGSAGFACLTSTASRTTCAATGPWRRPGTTSGTRVPWASPPQSVGRGRSSS